MLHVDYFNAELSKMHKITYFLKTDAAILYFVWNFKAHITSGGGGWCMVATVRSPSPQCYRLPLYNFVSFDYNLTLSYTAAILDSKMVPIVVFLNYGDVKQNHVNKIDKHTLLQDRLTESLPFKNRVHHNWDVFWAFSSLWRPSWIIKIAQRWHLHTTLDIFI